MDHVVDKVDDTPSSPDTAQGVVRLSLNEDPVTSEEVHGTSEEVAVPTNEVAAVAVDEVAAVSSDAVAGDDDVTVSSDDVAVSSSSHEVPVSSDEVAVSSSREVVVLSPEAAVSSDEVAADEVMVSLEEEAVVQSLDEGEVVVAAAAVSMESSFEVVVDSSAKEEEAEEEAPVEVEAPTGSDDGFVHVELSATQKDEAMKSLSSIIKSEEDQANNTDGDWVALSSPALKVQPLEESTTPPPTSDSSANTSVHVAPELGESRVISYHDVKTTSTTPAQDVDPTKRESYLSDAEFQTLFGMTKAAFYALPKWKQSQRKVNLDLF